MVFKDLLTKNLPVKRNDDSHPLTRLQTEMNRIFERVQNHFLMYNPG